MPSPTPAIRRRSAGEHGPAGTQVRCSQQGCCRFPVRVHRQSRKRNLQPARRCTRLRMPRRGLPRDTNKPMTLRPDRVSQRFEGARAMYDLNFGNCIENSGHTLHVRPQTFARLGRGGASWVCLCLGGALVSACATGYISSLAEDSASGSDGGPGPGTGSTPAASNEPAYLPVRVRRLTDDEWRASATALFGVASPTAATFTPDSTQTGFAVND